MKTEKAYEAIRRGGFLMAEYDADDDNKLKYRCVPGGGITPNQAHTIRKLELKPQADCLFPDAQPQTWRP